MAKYNNYKDTGIPWIGQIPLEWEVKRNKNVFSCNKNIVGSESSSTQLLSLTTNGIRKKNIDETGGKIPESYDTYQHVKANDIVMCLFDLDCSAVFSGLSKYDGMISPAYKILRCNESIMPGFADYWFRSVFVGRKFKYLAKNIRYSLTYEDFSALEIPCPTLIEQKAIVDYLDCVCSNVDSIIAEAQASIEEYKAWKSSIIYEAVTKGLDPNAEMKDSEYNWMDKVSATWNVIKITRVLDRSHPYPLGDGDHGLVKTTDYVESGIPYIRVQNLGWGTELDLSNVVYITKEKNDEIKNSTLQPNDILFAKTGGTIGKTAIVPEHLLISNTTSHVGKITVSKNYNPKYIFYVLSSEIGYNQFWAIASAKTTRPELSIDEIKSIRITMPPTKKEQDEIVSYLDEKCKQLDSLIADKESLIEDLESYKKSLIFEVVTGKRKVV